MSETPKSVEPDSPVEEAKLMDHEYDGILEYDNPTPGWMTFIFILCCIFSVGYFFFFHVGAGWTVHEAYENAKAKNLQKQFGELGELGGDSATVLKYSQDDQWLSVGRSVYETNCMSCHADQGQGLVGPNLTDEAAINVEQPADIVEIIRDGAANGAMPAWQNRLLNNEIVLVSAYVASLRGQDLDGPRGPEGDAMPQWQQ